jgi:Porin subfamily
MHWHRWIVAIFCLTLLSFVGGGPAKAADSAMTPKPQPVEYLKICDAFGAGYYYIPGTDTCLKIGGYVRIGGGYEGWCQTGEDVSQAVPATIGYPANSGHLFGSYSSFDGYPYRSANSLTAYEMLRQYAIIDWSTPSVSLQQYSMTNSMTNYGALHAYLQMEGASFGNNSSPPYQDSFGGTLRTQRSFFPNVTGNIRLDQAWGSAQYSTPASMPAASNPADTANTAQLQGWAIGTGYKINSPMLGAGEGYQYRFDKKLEFTWTTGVPNLSSRWSFDNIYQFRDLTGKAKAPAPPFDQIDDTDRVRHWARIHKENFGKEYHTAFPHSDGSTDYYDGYTDDLGRYVEEHSYEASQWDWDDWDTKDTFIYVDGKAVSFEAIDYGIDSDRHYYEYIGLSDGKRHKVVFYTRSQDILAGTARYFVSSAYAVEQNRPSVPTNVSPATALKANYDFWRAAPASSDARWRATVSLGDLFGVDYAKVKYTNNVDDAAKWSNPTKNLDFGHINFEKIVAPGFAQAFYDAYGLGGSPKTADNVQSAAGMFREMRWTSFSAPQWSVDLDLHYTTLEEWSVASAYAKAPTWGVPLKMQIAANLPKFAVQPSAQKARGDKGKGALPPAKPHLVLKLYTNKGALPVQGGSKPADDVGFDQDPVECMVDDGGNCTMHIAGGERRRYGLPGEEPLFKMEVNVPNSTSIVWREQANAPAPTLDSVRSRMPSLPPEARVKFRQFSIGDKKFTQATIETWKYNTDPDRWKAYLQPATKPKGSNKGGGNPDAALQDDCSIILPAPYGEGQPYPSDAGSRQLPQATILLPRGMDHRG